MSCSFRRHECLQTFCWLHIDLLSCSAYCVLRLDKVIDESVAVFTFLCAQRVKLADHVSSNCAKLVRGWCVTTHRAHNESVLLLTVGSCEDVWRFHTLLG
jgi:hypothetical protein